MSKKKPGMEEEEIFDPMMFEDDIEEEEMINTFSQVAEASIEHMRVACQLTEIIVNTRKDTKLTTDEILNIFRQSASTILDCTPLKALFEKS